MSSTSPFSTIFGEASEQWVTYLSSCAITSVPVELLGTLIVPSCSLHFLIPLKRQFSEFHESSASRLNHTAIKSCTWLQFMGRKFQVPFLSTAAAGVDRALPLGTSAAKDQVPPSGPGVPRCGCGVEAGGHRVLYSLGASAMTLSFGSLL